MKKFVYKLKFFEKKKKKIDRGKKKKIEWVTIHKQINLSSISVQNKIK